MSQGHRMDTVRACALAAELWQSQEFQSAAVRLSVWLVMTVFIGVAAAQGHYDIDWRLYGWLFGLHGALFAGLLMGVARRPALNLRRAAVAIAADLSAITLLIHVAGAPLAPFYLVYVLSFLSQGTRYGRTHLAIASIGSVLCYGTIASVTGSWGQHPYEVGFVLSALLVLPLYQYSLLRNLQQARSDAEAANRARGHFLATMTHELRTPVSGIVGMAGLLRRTELDADQRQYLESITRSAETLQALVGEVLDLSRVDAGLLELERARFDLRATMLEVCRNLALESRTKGVEFICCIDTSLPVHVTGDRVRFQQILYNLAGNAVKFTERGRVCVEADRVEHAAGSDAAQIVFVIDDTGVGIPADRLDCVFDRFWQAQPAPTRRHDGTGLGTTIAYRLVGAMGGNIAIESTEGEGSIVRVFLPLLAGDAVLDAPPAAPPDLAGRRVLIHDPDPRALDALSEACRGVGMIVDRHPGPRFPVGAGDLRVEQVPALALLGGSTTGSDLEARATALRRRLGDALPIVYLQYDGQPAPSGPERAQVVTKPFQPDEIWHAMVAALDGTCGSSPGPRAGRVGDGSPVPARILVAEDDAVNAQLVQTVLRHAGHRVEVARDGAAALAALSASVFDLLLVDLRMPGMDGIELARRVRAGDPPLARLPIVAVTASVAEEVRTDCYRAGIDAVLAKPLDPGDLDALLTRTGEQGAWRNSRTSGLSLYERSGSLERSNEPSPGAGGGTGRQPVGG